MDSPDNGGKAYVTPELGRWPGSRGVRFDDRATGKAAEFCPRARILHVDPSELGKIKRPTLGIEADVGAFLDVLMPRIGARPRPGWRERVQDLRAQHPLDTDDARNTFHPYAILRATAALLPPDTTVTTDVGQHQMWAAQAYPFRRPRQLLTSGGLGTMGFGLPAVIGAALATPGRPVVCVTGDGSLLMNIHQLATAVEEDVDVKVVLLNNGHLGKVRQQQELFLRQSPPRVALPRRARLRDDRPRLRHDRRCPRRHADATRQRSPRRSRREGPFSSTWPIDAAANGYPMVPPGAANREMIEGAPDLSAA